jgi:oligoendopeptidase F
MNIDLDKILYIGEDFFKSIDINLYNLYQTLLSKELIIEKLKHDSSGNCGYINGHLSGITLDMHIQNLYKVITLVHEMGHAYDNYLNKTQDNLSFQISIEVTSMTLELLFLYYLSQNNILSTDEIKVCQRKYLTDYLLRMNNAFIYNKFFIEKKLLIQDSTVDINELSHRRIILNNLSHKYLQFINENCNYYAVGLMFAAIFLEHYKNDAKGTIKEIKNFSYLSNSLTTKEIINYFDKGDLINSTSSNIKKALKKAH